MKEVVDILGTEIQVGDIIALAMRQGNNATLSTYRILSIEKNSDTWAYNKYLVKAQQVITGGWRKTTDKTSTLYGELFRSRALVIEHEN